MAIDREKLLADFKSEVGENSFSDRTWGTIADKYVNMAPEEDDKYKEFISNHGSIIKELQGQYNHDLGDATTKQVNSKLEEWKKSNPDRNVKPVEVKSPVEGNDDFKSLQETVQELKAAKEKMEREASEKQAKQTMEEKRNSIMEKLKENGCENKGTLDYVGLKLAIDGNMSDEDLIKEGKKIYDSHYKDLFGGTYNPSVGDNSISTKNSISKEAQQIIDKQKEKNKRLKL